MKALAPLQKFTEELAPLQGMINVQINVYDYDSVYGNESSRSITHVNGSISLWKSRWKYSLNRKTQKNRSLHCKGSLFIGTTLHVDVPHYTIFRILVSALIVLASLVLLLCILIFCDEMECVLFLKISG